MENTIRRVEEFLRMYEHNCTLDDAGPLVAQFTDPFQFAGAGGTKMLSRETFAALLPKRKSLFAQLGCGHGELVSIDTNLLDAHYILAKTRWRIGIRSGEVIIDASFMLQDVEGDLKIILYLPHEDLQSILESHGAVPAQV
jgi:hypothetical protein